MRFGTFQRRNRELHWRFRGLSESPKVRYRGSPGDLHTHFRKIQRFFSEFQRRNKGVFGSFGGSPRAFHGVFECISTTFRGFKVGLRGSQVHYRAFKAVSGGF